MLGDDFHPPCEVTGQAETVNLSNYGVRTHSSNWTVKVGFVLVLRISVSKIPTTVSTLAQVKWVKEYAPGVWHAGLSFML